MVQFYEILLEAHLNMIEEKKLRILSYSVEDLISQMTQS